MIFSRRSRRFSQTNIPSKRLIFWVRISPMECHTGSNFTRPFVANLVVAGMNSILEYFLRQKFLLRCHSKRLYWLCENLRDPTSPRLRRTGLREKKSLARLLRPVFYLKPGNDFSKGAGLPGTGVRKCTSRFGERSEKGGRASIGGSKCVCCR